MRQVLVIDCCSHEKTVRATLLLLLLPAQVVQVESAVAAVVVMTGLLVSLAHGLHPTSAMGALPLLVLQEEAVASCRFSLEVLPLGHVLRC